MRDDTHCIETIREQVSNGSWPSAKTGLFDALSTRIDKNHDRGKHIYRCMETLEKRRKEPEGDIQNI